MKCSFRVLCTSAFLCCSVLLAVMGCGGAQVHGNGPRAPVPQRRVVSAAQVADQPYRLQVGDQVEILFSGRGESTLKLLIQEDGTVPYPPTEPVQAAGRSLEELEREIQNRLNPEGESERRSADAGISEAAGQNIPLAEAMDHVYQLQRGDQLDITVWNQSDLNQKIQVREDGSFTFPLIGKVQAGRHSLPEVQKEIAERLNRDYIINPQVTVRLAGAQFSVLGQQGTSGSFPLDGTVDLLTAISKAGDIATLRSSRVELIRRQGDTQVVIRANVERILSGKDPNIPVLPRDTIYIKDPLSLGKSVSVRVVNAKFTALGEVQRPGAQPIEGPMDLLTALSLAGGINKFGSSRIEVFRFSGNTRLVIRVNMDRILQGKEPNISIFPRDTLYVRRRLF